MLWEQRIKRTTRNHLTRLEMRAIGSEAGIQDGNPNPCTTTLKELTVASECRKPKECWDVDTVGIGSCPAISLLQLSTSACRSCGVASEDREIYEASGCLSAKEETVGSSHGIGPTKRLIRVNCKNSNSIRPSVVEQVYSSFLPFHFFFFSNEAETCC